MLCESVYRNQKDLNGQVGELLRRWAAPGVPHPTSKQYHVKVTCTVRFSPSRDETEVSRAPTPSRGLTGLTSNASELGFCFLSCRQIHTLPPRIQWPPPLPCPSTSALALTPLPLPTSTPCSSMFDILPLPVHPHPRPLRQHRCACPFRLCPWLLRGVSAPPDPASPPSPLPGASAPPPH